MNNGKLTLEQIRQKFPNYHGPAERFNAAKYGNKPSKDGAKKTIPESENKGDRSKPAQRVGPTSNKVAPPRADETNTAKE